MELSSNLTEVTLNLHEIACLQKGDIIPIDVPDLIEVNAADIPIFRARLGVSDGNYSLQITEWVTTNRQSGLHDVLQLQDKSNADH